MSTKRQAKKSSVTYKGLGDGVTFLTEPLKQDTEITGPIAAKLWVSSATEDADLFLVVRAFSPDMKELVFQGALDPHTPLAQGWLRVSHRKLDKKLTLPYRPYHTHDEEQKLKKGEVVECDVEVWPTCIVVPAGYRVALSCAARTTSIRRRRVGGPEDARHRLDRRRPVPARRSARPPGRGVRRRRHAARRAGAECLSAAAGYSGEVAQRSLWRPHADGPLQEPNMERHPETAQRNALSFPLPLRDRVPTSERSERGRVRGYGLDESPVPQRGMDAPGQPADAVETRSTGSQA